MRNVFDISSVSEDLLLSLALKAFLLITCNIGWQQLQEEICYGELLLLKNIGFCRLCLSLLFVLFTKVSVLQLLLSERAIELLNIIEQKKKEHWIL